MLLQEQSEREPSRRHAPLIADDDALQDVLDAIADHVALIDAHGTVIAVNRAWAEFAAQNGYARDDRAVGVNYLELCDRATGDGAAEAWAIGSAIRAVLAGEQERFELLYPCHAPDEQRWFSATVRPMRRGSPTQIAAVVAHANRTAETIAVQSLQATEARLREQFSNMPVPTFLWELRADDFVLVDQNEAARRLTGDIGAMLVGVRAQSAFPGHHDVHAACVKSLQEHVVVELSITHHFDGQRDPRTFDITVGPQTGGRVLLHAIETTHATRLAVELREAQKMEAVGQLAGGVAHDFNNLLTVIGAHAAQLLEQLPPRDAGRGDAKAILQATDRAASLTRQLVAFGRKQMLQPSIVDLNQVIEASHHLIRRMLGEDVEVVLDTALQPLLVLVDAGQMEQVLMNVAMNARDAMPGGGRLQIQTAAVDVTGDERVAPSVPSGQYARISVSDTGIGMDEQTRGKVFEPFFTTKEPGKGPGLGLSTVYGIIRQSGGYVVVSSELGVGSVFDVYLPLSTEESGIGAALDSTTSVRGGETILVVEDDPALRAILKRVLSREGYQVVDAADGPAALAVAASHGPIDLVITDAVMPRMPGPVVIRAVKDLYPSARALLMSGHTAEEMSRRGIGYGNAHFLHKPFTPAELTSRVRRALANEPHTNT